MRFNENLYLDCLTLKNFATFTDQTIKFSTELNAIVGETGSGKSLILDALQLILGHRADKKLVRKDAEFTLIRQFFSAKMKVLKSFLMNKAILLMTMKSLLKELFMQMAKVSPM